MKTLALTVCASLLAAPAFAQSEAALKEFFEGRTVVVRLDMPATSSGVDVYPEQRPPIDFAKYGERLKLGSALRPGDSVMVTRIRLKDDLIEFHLGGGGFSDTVGGAAYVPYVSKSNREKDLERDIRNERDAARKRTMQDELDRLRRDRQREERDNDRARAANAAAEEARKLRVAEQRLQAGSRFNLRYKPRVPAGVTPAMVMAALAEYLEFPFVDGPARPRPTTATPPSAAPPSAAPPSAAPPSAAAPAGTLRKGLTMADAQALLGKPDKESERMEGKLRVVTAIFSRDDQRIEAEFVEGVLIRYAISSK